MQEGIKNQNIVPHTPQQNGVVEWMNRISMERARSMLNSSGLDNRLWEKFVNTTVYLINKSPKSTYDVNIP